MRGDEPGQRFPFLTIARVGLVITKSHRHGKLTKKRWSVVIVGHSRLETGRHMTAHQQHGNGYCEADLIAACDEVIALVQRTDTYTYSDGTIDRVTDRVTQLVDQMISMRATTLEGFRARTRALLTIYPSIASEGEAVGDSAMVAALVRDLIAARSTVTAEGELGDTS